MYLRAFFYVAFLALSCIFKVVPVLPSSSFSFSSFIFGQKFRQKINEENENEGLGKNINDAAGKVHQRYFEEVVEWIGDKERTDEDRITVLEVVEKLKKENEKIWGIVEMAKRWDEAVD